MPDTSEANSHRVRTDPFFYAIFSVIGGTYVLLIVGMLLADSVFIFTNDMSERVILDFSADEQGKQLRAGTNVLSDFRQSLSPSNLGTLN